MEDNALAGRRRSTSHIDKQALSEACKEFLAQDRIRNTMTIDEFEKYVGLFRSDYVKNSNPQKLQELGYQYARRTNMRVPVTIVDPNVIDDENGSMYAEMDAKGNVYIVDAGHKYQIIAVLPSWMPDFVTMDAGGPNATALAVEIMANTRNKASPFDHRGEENAAQFVKVFDYLNKRKLKEHQEEVQYLSGHLIRSETPKAEDAPVSKEKEIDDSDPTPMGVVWDD